MSLANSFPRALSLAPFWCLMVAHLEWPDMRSDLLQEALVDATVARELGMECGHGDGALPAEHRVALDGSPDLDARSRPLDEWRPDEDGVKRRAVEARRASRSVSNESRWRPYPLRRTVMSIAPNVR